MTVTEVRKQLENIENVRLGNKELTIFIDTVVTLPILTTATGSRSAVDLIVKSTATMRDFYKNKYDKIFGEKV